MYNFLCQHFFLQRFFLPKKPNEITTKPLQFKLSLHICSRGNGIFWSHFLFVCGRNPAFKTRVIFSNSLHLKLVFTSSGKLFSLNYTEMSNKQAAIQLFPLILKESLHREVFIMFPHSHLTDRCCVLYIQ